MRYRLVSLLATAWLIAFSAIGQPFERGDVIIHSMAGGCACEPMVPRADITVLDSAGAEKLYISSTESYKNQFPTILFGLWVAAPDRVFAATQASIVVSPDLRNVTERFLTDVSQLKLEYLSDILPLRSGDFLAMESRPSAQNPRLLKWAASGQVLAVFEVPFIRGTGIDWSSTELLADQCTVAWNGFEHTGRVHAFNICTNQAAPDPVVLPPGVKCVGGIRQLPNGDLLVATCDAVRRYTKAGKEVAVYDVPAWKIALTPDGRGFWASASWDLPGATIYRVDFAAPDAFAVYALRMNATAIAVAGEWRASLQPLSRRRSAGH